MSFASDRQMRRARRQLADYASRYGASANDGAPADFADGAHILAMTADEQARALTVPQDPARANLNGAAADAAIVYVDPVVVR